MENKRTGMKESLLKLAEKQKKIAPYVKKHRANIMSIKGGWSTDTNNGKTSLRIL